jgi:hypothetical protein
MPDIDSLFTEPGLKQVTILFSPADVDRIVTTWSADNPAPETVRLFALLRAAHEAFTAPGVY